MRLLSLLIPSLIATAGEYSTYIGNPYPLTVSAMTTDSSGNTYIVGNRGSVSNSFTLSTTQPTVIVDIGSSVLPNDVFVTKLDPSGNAVFTRAFAGKGTDLGSAVAVDPNGNIYIGGSTTSPDFPLSNALQTQVSASGAAFIVKLSPDGNTILYSTYFGGLAGQTSISAMTTDAKGNLFLTGSTFATDFPHTAGMPTGTVIPFRYLGAFVSAISAAGDKILFSGTIVGSQVSCGAGSSCFLSERDTIGDGIALDAAGNVYIAGNSNTIDLPATAGVLLAKGYGAFVAKINAGGTGLGYLTYIGAANYVLVPEGNPGNTLYAIAVDASGNAYLAGATSDPQFPATVGSVQPYFGGGISSDPQLGPPTDAFVAKLKPDGSAMVWATFLGGTGADIAHSVALDTKGNVWASGTTASSSFPNAQGWSQGGDLLVQLSADGSTLPYSGRYPNGTVSRGISVDAANLVHATGNTGIVSQIAPSGTPAMRVFGVQNVAGGTLAGRASPAEVISIYGPHIGPATAMTAVPSSGFYPTTLSGVQVLIGGVEAPLLYASDGQINAVVPMQALPGTSTLQINNGTTSSPLYPLWIDESDPMVFPGIVNQDGTLNSQTNPAKIGSIISAYATGWQSYFAPYKDGEVVPQANNVCFSQCLSTAGTVLYAGNAPGIVAGVSQLNIQLNAPSLLTESEAYLYIENVNGSAYVWISK